MLNLTLFLLDHFFHDTDNVSYHIQCLFMQYLTCYLEYHGTDDASLKFKTRYMNEGKGWLHTIPEIGRSAVSQQSPR